jgi:hypothetical protein
MDMKVAVIGGGLFGCTAATILAQNGAEVHLHEKGTGLFRAASGVNQYRLHKGYHYPRSGETIRECKDGIASFKRYYEESVIGGVERYYAIAAKGSQTSAAKYLRVLEENGLPFKVEKPISKHMELLVRVKEERVDHKLLRNICQRKMLEAGVQVFFDAPAYAGMRDEYDKIVVACYAGNNEVLQTLGCKIPKYQYEVCEKPVIMLERNPESWRTHSYRNFSLVVMDGPFCSLDPFGSTGHHVMGHVEHAIHSRNTGEFPEVPTRLQKYLDSGVVPKPIGSKWQKIKSSSKKFFPFLQDAMHVGSMFTVRTVLPRKDKTDERPTIVEQIDDKVIRIFSGKIGTAVQAAHTTLSLIQPNRGRITQSPAEQEEASNDRKETTDKSPLEVQPDYARLAKEEQQAAGRRRLKQG